jgi:hypothetical protein
MTTALPGRDECPPGCRDSIGRAQQEAQQDSQAPTLDGHDPAKQLGPNDGRIVCMETIATGDEVRPTRSRVRAHDAVRKEPALTLEEHDVPRRDRSKIQMFDAKHVARQHRRRHAGAGHAQTDVPEGTDDFGR